MEMLPSEQIEQYVKTIEAEKQEEQAKKKPTRAAGQGTASLPTRPVAEGEGTSDV